MKIMVVDDELLGRKRISEMLKDYGSVDEYENGQSALTAFQEALSEKTESYRLVTLDINMPGIDGLDVLNQMRQMEQANHITPDNQTVIIMITSMDDKNSCIKAISQKCSDYIVKPVQQETLINRLKRLKVLS